MKGNKRKLEGKMKKLFEGLGLRTCPQKGITLIALIITIIVMLILVGVTINVALNGGLFTTAQQAVSETQKEAEKEQLLSAVIGAIGTDAKVDFNKLDSNLPKDWKGSNATYTSPKGNVYTVKTDGTIEDGTTKKLECFGTTYTENNQTMEGVLVIDYANKAIKGYSGEIGQILTLMGTIKLSEIIINYDKPFYVLEDGKQIDIGTGATKIRTEDVPNNNNFIINGRFYMDVIEGHSEENYFPLLPDFDITRLREE